MKTKYFQGTVLAILFLSFLTACQDNTPHEQAENDAIAEVPVATTEADNELLNWKSYVSSDYQLAVQYPEDWMIIENNELPDEMTVINIFPTGETVDSSSYSETHGDSGFSYLAIYPKGLDQDFPWGRSMSFSETQIELPQWSFPVNETASRVLQLEDGSVWGFYIQPATLPETWADNGFIFVQYSVTGFQAACLDESSGAEKDMANCNFNDGDKLIRKGSINTEEAYTMTNILEALKLGGKLSS